MGTADEAGNHHGCCFKQFQSCSVVTMMDADRNSKKWTLFSAKVVAYTTLCSGKGCLLVFLLLSVPTILARLKTFMELAVFYLMVVSYFYVAWIWPSKYLIFALDEKEPSKFFPWVLSALFHSMMLFIGHIFKIFDLGWDSPEPITVSAMVVFLPQICVWIAFLDIYRAKKMSERARANRRLITEDPNIPYEDIENRLLELGLSPNESDVGEGVDPLTPFLPQDVSPPPVLVCDPPPPYSEAMWQLEQPGNDPPPPYSEISVSVEKA